MKDSKRKRLEAAGWRVGSVAEFLGLSPEESLVIEMKLAIAEAVRARRRSLGWTQHELAERFGSSQSRVAKLEAGERNVSMELLLTAFLSTGGTHADVVRVLESVSARGQVEALPRSRAARRSFAIRWSAEQRRFEEFLRLPGSLAGRDGRRGQTGEFAA